MQHRPAGAGECRLPDLISATCGLAYIAAAVAAGAAAAPRSRAHCRPTRSPGGGGGATAVRVPNAGSKKLTRAKNGAR